MTQNVSKVRARFSRVLDEALAGRPTLVPRRGRFVIIQACPVAEPIPDRPPGSFVHLYTPDEVARENRLAQNCTHAPEIE